MRSLLHTCALVLLAGCPSAPDEPTWAEDVQPILAANCIRCHGYPALGGAPAGFRLDVYEDTYLDGRVVRGAGAMAEFIAARARDGSMPPRFPLDGYQRDVLDNWWRLSPDRGVRPPRGAPADGNRPPAMTLLRPLDQSVVAGDLVLQYEIRDPDRDLVHGSLALDTGGSAPVPVARNIHAGRGQAVFDLGRFRDGTYPLLALLDDASGEITVELGDLVIDHGTNAPPRIVVDRPRRDELFTDADDPPADIDISLSDLDATDILTVDVDAVLDDVEVSVLDAATLAPIETQIAWDPRELPPSGSWRIRATITDGQSVRTVWSPPFIIAEGTTTETFDGGIASILDERCLDCHDGTRVPDLPFIATSYPSVLDYRGAIYRRVVQIGDMPPASGPLLDESPVDPITEEERARLKSWLEAGAPEQ